jgi:hypothetical protein
MDAETPECPKCGLVTRWKNYGMGEATCSTHGLYLVGGGPGSWNLIGPLPAENTFYEARPR